MRDAPTAVAMAIPSAAEAPVSMTRSDPRPQTLRATAVIGMPLVSSIIAFKRAGSAAKVSAQTPPMISAPKTPSARKVACGINLRDIFVSSATVEITSNPQ